VTCPYADAPNSCLNEYRRRTAALLHSWQTIPCTSCKHLRINGERAPRPVEESIPFKGKAAPRFCSECGGRLGNSNKSGVCQTCIGLLYGDKPKRERTAPKGISRRTACPKCGGLKDKRAAICGACRQEAMRKPDHCTMPGCRNKVEASGLCYRHYRSRPRRTA